MLNLSKSVKKATEKVEVSENDKNKAYERLQSFLQERKKLVATGANSLKKENKTEIMEIII